MLKKIEAIEHLKDSPELQNAGQIKMRKKSSKSQRV